LKIVGTMGDRPLAQAARSREIGRTAHNFIWRLPFPTRIDRRLSRDDCSVPMDRGARSRPFPGASGRTNLQAIRRPTANAASRRVNPFYRQKKRDAKEYFNRRRCAHGSPNARRSGACRSHTRGATPVVDPIISSKSSARFRRDTGSKIATCLSPPL
jgi:hypothetical protein